MLWETGECVKMSKQVQTIVDVINNNIITFNVIDTTHYCDIELVDLKIITNRINESKKVLFIFNSPDERKFFLNKVQAIVESNFSKLTLAQSIEIVNLITNNPFIYGNYRNMLVV